VGLTRREGLDVIELDTTAPIAASATGPDAVGSRRDLSRSSSPNPSGGKDAPGSLHAVVEDVPASWDFYLQRVAALEGRIPVGLLAHVAGPTDEGFRVIEIWRTRTSWERFRNRPTEDPVRAGGPHQIRSTLRDLAVYHTFPTRSDLNVPRCERTIG